MKLKITTISPIHIGSGETNPRYLYRKDKDYLERYALNDILISLQKNMKLDDFLKLNFTDDSDAGKGRILKLFDQYVHYDELKPLYYLFDYGYKSKNNVSEQIKSMYKPYIPGSSVKGSVMNAVVFHFIKQRIKKAIEYIEDNPKRLSDSYLLDDLYGKGFNDALEFYRQCLYCRDIYFKDNSLILCHSQRLNMKTNRESGFTDYECIDYGIETEGDFITFDTSKKEIFKEKFPSFYEYFQPLFLMSNLFVVIRNYYNRISQEDILYFKEHDFGLDMNLDDLYPRSEKGSDECILRIGNSTNYFFKTVSLLFKEHDFDIYRKHFDLFAPARLGKKNSPRADTMPKTRVVFEFDHQYYLPGILKIEKCK